MAFQAFRAFQARGYPFQISQSKVAFHSGCMDFHRGWSNPHVMIHLRILYCRLRTVPMPFLLFTFVFCFFLVQPRQRNREQHSLKWKLALWKLYFLNNAAYKNLRTRKQIVEIICRSGLVCVKKGWLLLHNKSTENKVSWLFCRMAPAVEIITCVPHTWILEKGNQICYSSKMRCSAAA